VKLSKIKHTISAYADALNAADAATAASGLRTLASFLNEFPNKEMSVLVQRASKAEAAAAGRPSIDRNLPSAGQLATCLDLLAQVLASTKSKGDYTKDLTALGKLLRGLGESETLSAGLDRLRDAMKPEPIEKQIAGFIERLKKETGTSSFDRTFEELAASPLKREHVVAVATSVYGRINRSTSRRAALDFIRKPHDAYVSAKRGIEASGGRSAA
jgi:hypothetical protein